ncbi:hypothetical protein CURTO8I2_60181 [Curtobacterium sp. 8I-2]|nr:hypothetical protein CURTO8I2_60181 [Curtobacterium sp. 8I-2]
MGTGLRPPRGRTRRGQHRGTPRHPARGVRGQLPARRHRSVVGAACTLHRDLVLRRRRRRPARPPGRTAHAARPRPRRRARVGGPGGRRERREGRAHGDPGLQDGVDVTTDRRDRRRPPGHPDHHVTRTTTTRHRHEERP